MKVVKKQINTWKDTWWIGNEVARQGHMAFGNLAEIFGYICPCRFTEKPDVENVGPSPTRVRCCCGLRPGREQVKEEIVTWKPNPKRTLRNLKPNRIVTS